MSFVVDWAKDKAAGYLKTGIQAGGTLAGNAVGGVGGLIESGGRQFGEGTVGGGIKGVGGYINTYGDGVKASMAADGPSSSAQKTTAVKPKPAATPKALPSTGAAKALPAPTAKTNALPKSAAQVSSKPSLKIPDGKTRISPASRPKPPTAAGAVGGGISSATKPVPRAVTKPAATAGVDAGAGKALTSAKTADGKVRIDPASRPKGVVKR